MSELFQNAKCDLTFWGSRTVIVKGCKDSISLNTLALVMVNAVSARCEKDDLTTGERIAAMELREKLISYYNQTDKLLENANFFTRLLNYIREFTFYPYTPRFHTEIGSMESDILGYSPKRYREEFGSEDEHVIGSFGSPYRLIVNINSIRAKWQSEQHKQEALGR